jgi:SWI/SNF-related matrix-associated actin-dependent regulator of chromatin subfamily A containing DEAD/H box 1
MLSQGCTPEQAKAIIELRPFDSVLDLNNKLGQGKKKAGPSGISPRIFEDCIAIFSGYGEVDSILEDCEHIGASLRVAIDSWTDVKEGKGKVGDISNGIRDTTASLGGDIEDGALSLVSVPVSKDSKPKDYLVTQPSLLSEDVQLKDYQLLGVNWLNLLHRRKLSCILADEMGMSFLSIFLSVLLSSYVFSRSRQNHSSD